MEYKDYYKILGVDRNASEKEIKKAYRRLARKYHPDVNPGDKQAEERFKEINEAHEVLTDPEKRRKYDQFGSNWQQWESSGRPPEDFWRQYGGARAQPDGQRVYTEYVDLNDLFGGGGAGASGAGGFSDFFEALFGGMRGTGSRTQTRQRTIKGQDIEQPVEVTLQEAMQGSTRLLQLGNRRLEVKIPPGVDNGSRIRIAGEGAPGFGGGPNGDLYLVVSVRPYPNFTRDGDDLRTTVPVDLYTAILGGEAKVQTPTGNLMLKIPPGTQNGQTIRLRGQGMPRLKAPDQRGDLYAEVRVILPEKLSEQEKELFRKLASLRK